MIVHFATKPLLPISFKNTSPALEQSHDCSCVSEVTLKNTEETGDMYSPRTDNRTEKYGHISRVLSLFCFTVCYN